MNEFKLIVAGGRNIFNEQIVLDAIVALAEGELKEHNITIVSRCGQGAEQIIRNLAYQQGVKVYDMPFNWRNPQGETDFTHNVKMADFADGLLAFSNGNFRPTKHLIKVMRERNKFVQVLPY